MHGNSVGKAAFWFLVHSLFGLAPLLLALFPFKKDLYDQLIDESIGCFFSATVVAVMIADYALSSLTEKRIYLLAYPVFLAGLFLLIGRIEMFYYHESNESRTPHIVLQVISFAVAAFISLMYKTELIDKEELLLENQVHDTNRVQYDGL